MMRVKIVKLVSKWKKFHLVVNPRYSTVMSMVLYILVSATFTTKQAICKTMAVPRGIRSLFINKDLIPLGTAIVLQIACLVVNVADTRIYKTILITVLYLGFTTRWNFFHLLTSLTILTLIITYLDFTTENELKPIKNIHITLNSITFESNIEYYYKYNSSLLEIISKKNETLETPNIGLIELKLCTFKENLVINNLLLIVIIPIYLILTLRYKKSL